MSREATDLVMGLAAWEQAEYAEAAARKNSPAADVEGSSASGAQTPVAEHRQERCPRGPVRSAAGGPTWSSVDDTTADLLTLVARDKSGPWADEEWHRFTQALEAASDLDGRIDPNFLRPLLRGSIAPNRIGAFTNRAKAEGLIAWDGEWITSDDREGKNSGKPTRVYRYLGT